MKDSGISTKPVLLELWKVSKRFASPGGSESVEVLKEITLDLREGDSLAVIGPSGSGKSTLLNIIGTLDKPSDGRVSLGGEDLSRLDDGRLAQVRNRQIGFVFQAHHLLPQCTVLENVLVPTLADRHRANREATNGRAKALLERVGLGARVSHRPGQLSGGERQRVAVVRALINQPRLLLADEPTGALDRVSAQNLSQLLVEINRETGVALIVVTHALDLAHRMEHVFELKDGTLQAVPPS